MQRRHRPVPSPPRECERASCGRCPSPRQGVPAKVRLRYSSRLSRIPDTWVSADEMAANVNVAPRVNNTPVLMSANRNSCPGCKSCPSPLPIAARRDVPAATKLAIVTPLTVRPHSLRIVQDPTRRNQRSTVFGAFEHDPSKQRNDERTDQRNNGEADTKAHQDCRDALPRSPRMHSIPQEPPPQPQRRSSSVRRWDCPP